MNLIYTEKTKGKANFFIEKIWNSLLLGMNPYLDYLAAYEEKYGKRWDGALKANQEIKGHSIRVDKGNRWKVGSLIHFVINPYNKKRFQFAPVLPVKSIQKIIIERFINLDSLDCRVIIDGRNLKYVEIEELAFRDGFDSSEAFLDYFKGNFEGKIIHWTDLKY